MSTVHIDELPRRYTYEDYRQWEGDWELIEGISYSMAPNPAILHQGITSKIVSSLDTSISSCPGYLVLHAQDWKLSDSTTLRPDVVLVCNEPGADYITQRPEIVIEVVSQSSVQRDEQIKFRIYAEQQVPYYVIVYPNELKAQVFKLEADGYEKVGDCTDQRFDFSGRNIACAAMIDFDVVFSKFR